MGAGAATDRDATWEDQVADSCCRERSWPSCCSAAQRDSHNDNGDVALCVDWLMTGDEGMEAFQGQSQSPAADVSSLLEDPSPSRSGSRQGLRTPKSTKGTAGSPGSGESPGGSPMGGPGGSVCSSPAPSSIGWPSWVNNSWSTAAHPRSMELDDPSGAGEQKQLREQMKRFVQACLRGRPIKVMSGPEGELQPCRLLLSPNLQLLQLDIGGVLHNVPLKTIKSICPGSCEAPIPVDELCSTLVLLNNECVTFRLDSIREREEFTRSLEVLSIATE